MTEPLTPCPECGAFVQDHAYGCPALARKMAALAAPAPDALRRALNDVDMIRQWVEPDGPAYRMLGSLRDRLAVPPAAPEGLDVERLARAMKALDTGPDGLDYSHTYAVDSPEAFAEAIAAEYARLASEARHD